MNKYRKSDKDPEIVPFARLEEYKAQQNSDWRVLWP